MAIKLPPIPAPRHDPEMANYVYMGNRGPLPTKSHTNWRILMPAWPPAPGTIGAILAILVIVLAIVFSPLALGKLDAIPAILFVMVGVARLT
jgi:hypothetical protein